MLNGAWPNLHWQLFDYYLKGAWAYYGTKVGSRSEHIVYNYQDRQIYAFSRSLNTTGRRTVMIDLIDADGHSLGTTSKNITALPNNVQKIGPVPGINRLRNIAFLRLILKQGETVVSRNLYWLSADPASGRVGRRTPKNDVLDWDGSDWYHTPVTEWANYTSLFDLPKVNVTTKTPSNGWGPGNGDVPVELQNNADSVAFFVRLNLVDKRGQDVIPQWWSDN
jgi:exo-1,4-beta-D-glucosaminidase